jgi:hypothetical protein
MSRLIIVPPKPVADSHSHSIRMGSAGTVVQTDLSSQYYSIGDPVESILAFYLPESIGIATAKGMFRSQMSGFDGMRRALAEEWVARHCTLPALAQPSESASNADPRGVWSIWFCDGTLRRDQFHNWSLSATAHRVQSFTIRLPEEEKVGLALEIDACVKQLTRGNSFISHNGSSIAISFWDEADAVEFKLRWSDYFC